MRVGVVACSKSKLPHAAKAADLYQGTLFRRSREVVEATCARWCILSAEYGVTLPTKVIQPYDKTLLRMSAEERRAWAQQANTDLIKHFGRDALFVVYAGRLYRSALEGLEFDAPLEGLGLGRQVQALNQLLDERARKIREEQDEKRGVIGRQLAVELMEHWYCRHCNRPQYGRSLIYNVQLCLRCISKVAADSKWGDSLVCRHFLLERENARLNRLVDGLRARNAALVKERRGEPS